MFSSPDLNPTITAFRQPYASTRKRTENSLQLRTPRSCSYHDNHLFYQDYSAPPICQIYYACAKPFRICWYSAWSITTSRIKSWYQNCFTHKLHLPINTKPGNTRASRGQCHHSHLLGKQHVFAQRVKTKNPAGILTQDSLNTSQTLLLATRQHWRNQISGSWHQSARGCWWVCIFLGTWWDGCREGKEWPRDFTFMLKGWEDTSTVRM